MHSEHTQMNAWFESNRPERTIWVHVDKKVGRHRLNSSTTECKVRPQLSCKWAMSDPCREVCCFESATVFPEATSQSWATKKNKLKQSLRKEGLTWWSVDTHTQVVIANTSESIEPIGPERIAIKFEIPALKSSNRCLCYLHDFFCIFCNSYQTAVPSHDNPVCSSHNESTWHTSFCLMVDCRLFLGPTESFWSSKLMFPFPTRQKCRPKKEANVTKSEFVTRAQVQTRNCLFLHLFRSKFGPKFSTIYTWASESPCAVCVVCSTIFPPFPPKMWCFPFVIPHLRSSSCTGNGLETYALPKNKQQHSCTPATSPRPSTRCPFFVPDCRNWN